MEIPLELFCFLLVSTARLLAQGINKFSEQTQSKPVSHSNNHYESAEIFSRNFYHISKICVRSHKRIYYIQICIQMIQFTLWMFYVSTTGLEVVLITFIEAR